MADLDPLSFNSADDLSVIGAANAILLRRHWVVRAALGFTVLTLSLLLVRPRSWSTEAALVTAGRSSPAALSGLAAQFGVIVPTADPSQSPQFYADFVQSRTLLGEVVAQSFGGSDLATRWKISTPDSAQRRDLMIRKLSASVTTAVTQKTGVLRVRVVADDANLSHELITAILGQLNQFNLETRRSRAGAERRFTERRLAEARIDLGAAEDRLQRFVASNRDIRNSSSLTLEQQRLIREVTLQQQIHLQIALSFEQARIEEVRDTPMLLTTEPPFKPFAPDSRHLLRNGLAALLLGTFIGMIAALLANSLDESTGRVNEKEAFARLTSALRRDLFSRRLFFAPPG